MSQINSIESTLNIQANTDRSAGTANSRGWRWRLAAIMLGLLPFVVLESVLRFVVGPPAAIQNYDADPYVDLHQLRPLFVLDEAKQRWQIPPERLNFFQPASFDAMKQQNARRIFVLGGSTVQGRPYATETAFAKWLELQLQVADPSTHYEVVNCGGVSYASYRVAKILQEVLQHAPDAIVLYTGHNEFLENRTYASVREMGAIGETASHAASSLMTVRWVKSLIGSETRRAIPKANDDRSQLAAEVDAILDHAGGLGEYHRDPKWHESVHAHFESTYRRMLAMAQKANVPIIACVPASDLVNTPPFKIEPSPRLTPEQQAAFASHYATATDGRMTFTQRSQAASKCTEMDPQHAGANFILGSLLYHSGLAIEAKQYLIRARDTDVCPLRADSRIESIVTQLATASKVPIVDTRRLLDQQSVHMDSEADGIADAHRFVDHVHPSIAGHREIARALAAEFQSLGWIQSVSDDENAFQQTARKHLESLGAEYFARGKQRLEGLRLWASGRAGQLGTDDR